MVETMAVVCWRIHFPARAMRAIRTMLSLAEKSSLPDSLHRYEGRYETQYNRAANRPARPKNEKIRERSHQPIENKEEGL